MQAKTLQAITKICERISNQSSLTPLYQSIELGPTSARCCSEFGNIAIVLDATGLTEPCLINTAAVRAVASTLPSDANIELVKQDNRVKWKAGNAKGQWNLVGSDHDIPTLDHSAYPWTPDARSLSAGLRLASSACQAAAVSVGLYGIVLEPVGDKLHLMSSNSISLAKATIDKGSFPTGKITIRPPVPGIIAALIETCPNCKLDITTDGIFISGDWLSAHLPVSVDLEHDLLAIAEPFTDATQFAQINADSVRKFITRARSLTDRNTTFTVHVKVEEGKLVLEHKSMASSTEEYFLCEGLDASLNYATAELPADMLLLPLQFVNRAVFDYMGAQQLILKGDNPEFTYILSGGPA